MVKRAKVKENEDKRTNPILWFLFAILVPIIVALTLAVIVLTVAGVNVPELAKSAGNHIPGISSLITTDDEKQAEHKRESLEEALKQKNEKIDELEQNVDELEAAIEDMELQAKKAENSTETNDKDNNEKQKGKQQDSATSMAASFKDMQPRKAALIFDKLDEDKALVILDKLSNKARGDIFQEMEPDLAATLTKKLMDQN